ncbi:large conductance mechanosensitive channel protein MscL [Peloplasma aerotolerans]|uniref:Large-conductance mechanosensitive channel n=1 Tax=Peloplasma aerotolerans TaxID=3044389 RepID=A0AAW6U441_9MOLU|nr:large conductance mechanosensitive channel protein MscL [Mariniplasma sp. M4Ah]MDI6452662.1 large conductance mechanosensitive channel protein MscL [Mariniplasma sp. M4Ah]MDR4969164.1 large conductance mechanosensitive channel protein MscL [Acholeplasmataceae bacterium]
MKKFFKDFKSFMMKGNVLNLAVAVIIGGAFGKIIASMVKDILMPVISILIGKNGFENYKYIITEANPDLGIVENAINYGLFFQNVIDFIIVAFVIYIIVRLVTKATILANQKQLEEEKAKKAEEERIKKEKDALEAKQPKVQDLLMDIKILLEKNLKAQKE